MQEFFRFFTTFFIPRDRPDKKRGPCRCRRGRSKTPPARPRRGSFFVLWKYTEKDQTSGMVSVAVRRPSASA